MDAKIKRYITLIIHEYANSMIHSMLYEQQEPAAEAPATSTPDTSASDTGPVEGMVSAEEGMTGESQGMSTDSGGGFGGVGGIGGGGGGGGGGESGDSGGDTGGDTGEGSTEETGAAPETSGPKADSEDPVGSVVETAEQLANSTDNVANITKTLKASIQVNFSNYADAWPIVQQLKNSENETLRAVSRRLALFIAGA